MIFDGHIHMQPVSNNREVQRFTAALSAAGISGGLVMSPYPTEFPELTVTQRMDSTLAFCAGQEHLYPVYFVDPTEEDAPEQVDQAVKLGFDGFKMICSGFYPSDDRVMNVCRRAAQHKKPVIFHSGILWDGRDSARYNRPGEFECLIEIPELKFSLAHVSWPWCDECIAVYGKFNNAYACRPETSCEMFIDITPGTPKLWREEVFRKLFCGDYEVMYNVMFGTDSNTENYNTGWAKEWLERDKELFHRFELDQRPGFLEHIYRQNLLRFLGKSDEQPVKKIPLVGQ